MENIKDVERKIDAGLGRIGGGDIYRRSKRLRGLPVMGAALMVVAIVVGATLFSVFTSVDVSVDAQWKIKIDDTHLGEDYGIHDVFTDAVGGDTMAFPHNITLNTLADESYNLSFSIDPLTEGITAYISLDAFGDETDFYFIDPGETITFYLCVELDDTLDSSSSSLSWVNLTVW